MKLRSDNQNWGSIAVTLHWLVAATVFALFGLGLWMTELGYYDPWYQRAPFLHKSTGALLFFLLLVRLSWRLFNTRPADLASHATWERHLAHAVHLALYLLLLAIMVSGYLISTADGRAIDVFGWFELPAYPLGVERQEEIAGTVHFYLAVILIGLAALHAAGALKHHFLDRDETLKRMLRIR
jgi:cytochrome b561